MQESILGRRTFWMVSILFSVGLLLFPTSLLAGKGNWWDVQPESENPSPYYDSILYSEIAPKLREIELNSDRVGVEVIGQSVGGRNLFLVTLSGPDTNTSLGQYWPILNSMIKDPGKAQQKVDKFGDFKVPVFINAGIHGNEYTCVDAAIRLIEYLAYGDSQEVKSILEDVVLMINVVQNPDGRVSGTLQNSNNVDLNVDFFAQTQPETRAIVKLITEWNPLVLLDLHNKLYPSPLPPSFPPNTMLIEPCGPPHNPNYEYDLYIKWALYQAIAMEQELFDNSAETAIIPFIDSPSCNYWPPIRTSTYAMYHGTYGHTLETQYVDERGVDAHFYAILGALKYVGKHRQDMVRDQIEVFRRGFFDEPQEEISDCILAETIYSQGKTTREFPAAYVIPANGPMQLSPQQLAFLVDLLLFNTVQVEKANESFTLNTVTYPKGTHIVWMDQPKRGLATAFLEYRPGVVVMQKEQNIKTSKVKDANP